MIDNVFVGREPGRLGGLWLDRDRMARGARQVMHQLGEDLPLEQPVGELSLAQRQMVSIARALLNDCRILILDEPTASLSARETQSLFRAIKQLQAQGVGILYVSHRLEEIFQMADRVTALRRTQSDGHPLHCLDPAIGPDSNDGGQWMRAPPLGLFPAKNRHLLCSRYKA